MDEYEWEFMQDSMEKKRIARGAHHKASRKRGFKGAMKTPIDNLKGKARKIYMNEVTTSSIISFAEFKELPLTQRAKVMAHLLQKNKRSVICSAWGITPGALSGIVYRMKKASPELSDKLGGPIRPISKAPVENAPVVTAISEETAIFQVSINGEFNGADLSARILGFLSMLDTQTSDKRYQLALKLVELED
jgi:hypothetical protein